MLRVMAATILQQRRWSAKEVRDAVLAKGIAATPKQVYNAIGYFRRKGYVRQIAYGHYVVEGIGAGIVTPDDLGVEPRIEDDLKQTRATETIGGPKHFGGWRPLTQTGDVAGGRQVLSA